MTKFQKVKPFFIFVVLFIFLLAGSNSVLCKKLPSYENKNDYRAADYPEYEQYFEEYITRIKDAYTPEKYFKSNLNLDSSMSFQVGKDGSIRNFSIYGSTEQIGHYNPFCWFNPIHCVRVERASKKFNKYVEDIVNDASQPFPKDIEYDEMGIEVRFFYYPSFLKRNYNTYIDYYYSPSGGNHSFFMYKVNLYSEPVKQKK